MAYGSIIFYRAAAAAAIIIQFFFFFEIVRQYDDTTQSLKAWKKDEPNKQLPPLISKEGQEGLQPSMVFVFVTLVVVCCASLAYTIIFLARTNTT